MKTRFRFRECANYNMPKICAQAKVKGELSNLSYVFTLPIIALKKFFNLNSWPVNKVCALKRFEIDRKTRKELKKIKASESKICQKGTFPAASRVIIVTGEVGGNKLKNNDIAPFGLSMIKLININGMIKGIIRTVVACEASFRFGTKAPTPAIKLA